MSTSHKVQKQFTDEYAKYLRELIVQAENRNSYLGQVIEQTVTTQLTKEQWREYMRRLDEFGKSFEADTDYEKYQNKLFSNMMPIGTQGCTLDNMLMFSGGDADRIMYIISTGIWRRTAIYAMGKEEGAIYECGGDSGI